MQCVLHAGEDLVPDSFEVFTFRPEISVVRGVEGRSPVPQKLVRTALHDMESLRAASSNIGFCIRRANTSTDFFEIAI